MKASISQERRKQELSQNEHLDEHDKAIIILFIETNNAFTDSQTQFYYVY